MRTAAGAVAGILMLILPGETENAVANGDTRTIQLYHAHTKESITATYLVNGSYDQSVLDKLNWFLRDWRRDEPTKMDPRLFDTIWEVYRESGSSQPIEVMSAYRSPETNAMLRRRSRQVAEHSQHILGKAMDQHYMDVPMSKIREIAMRLQRGGVGFYPTAGTPFVHMDVGGVRHWPRMSYDQLARLFPDGKTVHIPSNGQPLPGYELARAELEARGDGTDYPTATQVKSKGFFAWLFGGGDDEDDAGEGAAPAVASRDRTQPNGRQRVASLERGAAPASSYNASSRDDTRSFFSSQAAQPSPFGGVPAARAQAPLPAPAPEPQPVAPEPQPAPEAVPAAAPALAAAAPDGEAPLSAATLRNAPALNTNAAIAAVGGLPAQAMLSNGVAVPLPPRRPVELAALMPDFPMPPVRPSELSKSKEQAAPTPASVRLSRADAIAALIGPGNAQPDVIGRGAAPSRSPGGLLGYAGASGSTRPQTLPSEVPLPVARPAPLVLARLDRSNFNNLTSATKTEKAPSRAVLGSTVIGIRAASRSAVARLDGTTSLQTSFGAKATALPTDRFTGSAVGPADKLVTTRRADAGAD